MKVYFAGMESIHSSYPVNVLPTDNIFCTFFYHKKTDAFLKKINKLNGHKGTITIDSGAHTFFGYTGESTMAHHNSKDKSKMPCPDKYFARYFEWIKENYEKISYYVELDIQSIVGMDKVRKWRAMLKSAGVFDKCILVAHSVDTWEDFVELCEESESKYIGFEGLRAKKILMPYTKMLKYCYERQIKVHGFALTDASIASNFPFSTVDSTTWTAPVRFGSIIVVDGGKLKQVAPTKANYLKYKVSPDMFKTDRSKEASTLKLNHAMESQREYEKFLTRLWETRGIKWNW